MCESRRLVSLLLGEAGFADVLVHLPDSFFSLFPETQDYVWGEVLNAVNQGMEDPKILGALAESVITGSDFQLEPVLKLTKEHGDEPVFEVFL